MHLRHWSSGGYVHLRRSALEFKLVELAVVRNLPLAPPLPDPKQKNKIKMEVVLSSFALGLGKVLYITQLNHHFKHANGNSFCSE